MCNKKSSFRYGFIRKEVPSIKTYDDTDDVNALPLFDVEDFSSYAPRVESMITHVLPINVSDERYSQIIISTLFFMTIYLNTFENAEVVERSPRNMSVLLTACFIYTLRKIYDLKPSSNIMEQLLNLNNVQASNEVLNGLKHVFLFLGRINALQHYRQYYDIIN